MESPESVLARALNHLLAPNAWARERLRPFAGKVVELRAAPLPVVRLRIDGAGLVERAGDVESAALVVGLQPGILLSLTGGIGHAMRDADLSGDMQLGGELLFLARHLRWDAEEDLARVFGDVLARRIVGGTKHLLAATAEAGRRTAEALMDYAIEERELLVTRTDHDALASANARLRDAIERLGKRIEQLG
jgi:ubiquinone biosynthesis protein UbiJ